MPVTPPTVPVPAASAPPLRLSLPGGLVVAGVATQVGATSLSQALALVEAAGPAMAPLGPVFSIIDALLAVKAFAEAVPGLITNPGALVDAITDLVAKITRLGSLIPQLSVPLMLIGVIDAAIALLSGLALELGTIAAQEARIAAATAHAATLPAGPGAALLTITAAATAAVAIQKGDVAQSLAGAGPLLGIATTFGGLIGLGGVSVDVDVTAGSTQDAVDALDAAVVVLQTFRGSIPV